MLFIAGYLFHKLFSFNVHLAVVLDLLLQLVNSGQQPVPLVYQAQRLSVMVEETALPNESARAKERKVTNQVPVLVLCCTTTRDPGPVRCARRFPLSPGSAESSEVM